MFEISTKLRAKITRTVIDGQSWHGTRRGVSIKYIRLSNQPDLEHRRVEYDATFRRGHIRGVAGTVYEALQNIAYEVEKRKRVAA